MNSSFLDRSMDTINFNNSKFLEPQFKSNYTNKSKKEHLEKKGNGHLDRVFDQTTINPHFAGLNEQQMKLSFRPTSSFDIEQEMKLQKPNVRQNDQAPQRQRQQQQQQQQQGKQETCQYCDSYRKKNTKYETMIYNLQKEVAVKGNEVKKASEELKNRDKSGLEIRREHDKIQNQLKQKNMECDVLEKKIMGIQLEKQEKNKSLVEEEVKKANEKYYKMVKHYEYTIGILRKEVIESKQEETSKPDEQDTPDTTDKPKESYEKIKSLENKSPIYNSLVQILCKKLNKTTEDIELKLINYPIPEKISAEELNKILNLYK